MLKMPSHQPVEHPCLLKNVRSHSPERLLVIRRKKLLNTFYELFNGFWLLQVYLPLCSRPEIKVVGVEIWAVCRHLRSEAISVPLLMTLEILNGFET